MLLYKRQSHNATVGCFAPWGTAHTYTLSKLLNELRSSANKNQLFHLWQMLKSPGWCWLRFANVGSILIKNSVNKRRSRSRMTIKFWTKLPLNKTRLVGGFFFFFWQNGPLWHISLPFTFYFRPNLILPIFYYLLSFTLPISNSISSPFPISKRRRDEKNINEGLRNS